jgi:protocatechuate 3,4-dioxygenase, alpha subunit
MAHPTPSQTVGPYLRIGLTQKHAVGRIAGSQAQGEAFRLTCRVFDGDGVPVNDAMIEVWQADARGRYHHPEDPLAGDADPHCAGFGRMGTDENGSMTFQSVKPGPVPGVSGHVQAPHLNVLVFSRGLLQHQFTRMYFAGEPANHEDSVLAMVPEERRDTLMAQPDPERSGHWRFDIYLCGERETVFFDV